MLWKFYWIHFLIVHFNFIRGEHNSKSISDRHLVYCIPNRKQVIQYPANREDKIPPGDLSSKLQIILSERKAYRLSSISIICILDYLCQLPMNAFFWDIREGSFFQLFFF